VQSVKVWTTEKSLSVDKMRPGRIFECRKQKDDKIQLHVEISRTQSQKLHAALKILGYRTTAELLREHVRRIIAEAEQRAQSETHSQDNPS
jgi:hypothetical protein